MTTETDLLPLPEKLIYGQDYYFPDQMLTYAHANVARAIAAKDAVIAHERWLREQAENRCVAVEDQREALRAEVVLERNLKADAIHACALANIRAERLAEVLRRILDNEAPDWKFAEEFGGYVLDDELREEALAALEQEDGHEQ